MGWKVRFALTDGSTEKRTLLTLWSTPKGVHATVAGDKLHSSYHVDGQRHVTGDPDKDAYNRRLYPPVSIRKKTPAVDLIGVEELHVVELELRNKGISHASIACMRVTLESVRSEPKIRP